jgi:hypothetical protein
MRAKKRMPEAKGYDDGLGEGGGAAVVLLQGKPLVIERVW